MGTKDDLQAALDVSTSEDELERLSKSRSPQVRQAVAQNIAAPKSALARLFLKFPTDVVANPARSLFDMEKPNEDPLWWVGWKPRYTVAQNSNDTSVLDVLAQGTNPSIILNLVKNTHTSGEALDKFSRLADSGFVVLVGANPSTPPETLRRLASSPIRGIALVVSKNTSTPDDALRELTRHDYWGVRQSVAENPYASAETLDLLSRDSESAVRYVLAKSPRVPLQTLRRLANEDENQSVRDAALQALRTRPA